uniref:Uncharacterized protein n=1 Tax=Caenorhabditis japonica TaxID=281687 RepID=A0A8R1EFL8_CAEJA
MKRKRERHRHHNTDVLVLLSSSVQQQQDGMLMKNLEGELFFCKVQRDPLPVSELLVFLSFCAQNDEMSVNEWNGH